MSILLITLFVGNQSIRIQHFLKVKCLIFKKIFNHLSFLELLYKRKEKNPIDFLIDEIDVESYFFHNFLGLYVVKNRVLRLSKSLFRETYSIKEITCDPHIACQSFKLTAELHLTRKQVLFILENLKLIKMSYDNISKSLFIPFPIPKFVKTPQQSSLFLHFFKNF